MPINVLYQNVESSGSSPKTSSTVFAYFWYMIIVLSDVYDLLKYKCNLQMDS